MKRILIALFLVAFAGIAPAQAANITVLVNGRTVNFDQPPVEQSGRVFVPLRGVFEQLGATVVYDNGQINATGNGREISLHLGSTQATVNGQTQYLDQAPFEIGARTLVPLRFVAQALGASVNWNDQNQTVSINNGGASNGGRANENQGPNNGNNGNNRNNGNNGNNAGPSNGSFSLTDSAPTGNVRTAYPAIRARFSEPIRHDTLHVSIDGRDVTSNMNGNENEFYLTSPFALSSGTHRIRVPGTTQAGVSFRTGWEFTTGPAE